MVNFFVARADDYFIIKKHYSLNCKWAHAWAMGKIGVQQFQNTGFEYFEYLSGIYDARVNRIYRIPLLGFEARSVRRAILIKISNLVNELLAKKQAITLGYPPR